MVRPCPKESWWAILAHVSTRRYFPKKPHPGRVPEQQPGNPLQPEHFRRVDQSDDAHFYAEPRLVTHIDDAAIDALTQFYREALPPGGAILDLMSSWVSHLPPDVDYARVEGLGMNAAELERNPRLTGRTVHDLNRDPVLPYADDTFDAALICVSIQYLVRPVEVFTDAARVLKPGAPLIVSFSNRCFPTKAIAAWQMLDDRGHGELVGLYFRLADAFEPAQAFPLVPPGGPSDPLYVAMARTRPGNSTGITPA